ncbi:MAG: bifunctional 5,10-methylenetetrahydrofolate dehydrogenase/5,10-methenyltetrahydrofolate cyclohydrolase [Candidatus Bilamarchaeaceae archaeon]
MLLEGRLPAEKILANVKKGVLQLGFSPGLAIIRVGEDPASKTYVVTKLRRAQECGISGKEYSLSATTPEKKIMDLIRRLNKDRKTHGIIVQLPLPSHFNSDRMLNAISPDKDVDGLHPVNMGRLLQGNPHFVPATPQGIMEMFQFYKIPVAGKNAVVVGRSAIVGKPMAALLLNADATVEVCHSKTRSLAEHTRRAEILVAAVGKPHFITSDMVKEGAVVIDVGINRTDGKIVGDVDFEKVSGKAGAITPVPGGVGLLTVACLMKNVLKAAGNRTAAAL